MTKVLSSFFERSFTRAIMCWPAPSRAAQRRIEATTSSAVTRRAVGELQPVAQLERIGELVVGEAPLADHLRLRALLAVEREQRVVDHRAVVGGDVRGGPDRVERAQVALHHGADGARAGRGLRADDAGSAGKRGCGERALNETPAGGVHRSLPLFGRFTHGTEQRDKRASHTTMRPSGSSACGQMVRRALVNGYLRASSGEGPSPSQ